jgi:hypothetical protein
MDCMAKVPAASGTRTVQPACILQQCLVWAGILTCLLKNASSRSSLPAPRMVSIAGSQHT